jgi:hypothetical protein
MNSSQMCRYFARGVMSFCVASVVVVAPSVVAAERLGLQVRETAGLARGGYPAHALLELPRPVPETTKFRLLNDGKPIAAQFRPDRKGRTAHWWLDFPTEIAPFQTKNYTVEFGEDVTGGPERSSGHKLTEVGDAFLIRNAPYITWTVPRNLQGFLRSVDFPPSEFLRPDSLGLLLRDRYGRQHVITGTARVVRQGTMAIALRFEKAESQGGLAKVRSVVDLTFPAPVSWVELDWSIDDPIDNVAALGLKLHLNLAMPSPAAPTAVDFGATSLVYTSLRHGQTAELSAGPLTASVNPGSGPPWRILRGDEGHLVPFALGRNQSIATPVEGWAHVMDRKNCLALAVDAFGRDTHDRITTSAKGEVSLWREYGTSGLAVRKRLRCWLHFVFFPPQHSAGASPQQMQAPLVVRLTGRSTAD